VDPKRLEALPLFRDLSRREREKIARWADEVDLKAGYHLLDQGRFPHEFFVIEEGEVEVRKDGELVTTLGPGDFLGEIAIMEHDRRTASVVASSPVSAIVMGAREFEAMSKEMPSIAERVHAAIRERMAR
jgi:CRP/FNR family transcriptional regulator, cyclic AMP receptor protein